MQSSGFSQGSECVLVFRSTKLSPAESSFRNAQDAFLGKMSCTFMHCFGDISLTPTCSVSFPHHLSWALKTSLSNIPTAPTTNSSHLVDYFHFLLLSYWSLKKKKMLSEGTFWGFRVTSCNHISFYQGREPPNRGCHPLAEGRFGVWCCSARQSLSFYGWT